MSNRVYVGNLPFTATIEEIKNFFGEFKVGNVKIITDRETGKPRGFAFVDLDSTDEVRRAVSTLDRVELGGRTIVVNEAREPERRGGGGSSNGRRDRRERRNSENDHVSRDDYAESWKR